MNKSVARHTLFALATLFISALPGFSATVIQKSVTEAVSKTPASSYIEVLISFENDLDLASLKMNRLREKPNRTSNYRDVMSRLTRNREELENSILSDLLAMKAIDDIDYYKFFTVSKTIMVRTRAGNVERLSRLPGVSLISLNHAVSLIDPVETTDAPTMAMQSPANSALEAVNVRSLWDRGLTGRGSLICSFDTGVDGDHPALSSKWRGNNGAAADASWFAPHTGSTPQDNIGHGSHVMGTMVGSTATDTVGVAPGAQWISAAVIDQGASFSTTIADILSAFDWALNPDGNIGTVDDLPDVICNSWGVPRGIYGDCDNTFWAAIDNIEAAGIVTIFAAGNEGPALGTMRNPADRASSPLNTLSVGAVDHQSLLVADFSSRGPASCDGASIKPELVAPGVSIYSTTNDGTYKYMSGTSMAAPFVAGLVALMRQYNPEATVEEIKNALIQATLDLGPAGEDNAYGYGMIDASQVLDYLPAPELPHVAVYNHSIHSGGDNFADPGETAEISLTLNEPTGLLDSVDVWVSSNSEWVASDPDTIRYIFAQGATYAVSLDPFYLHVSPDAISGNSAWLEVHFRFLNGLGEDTVAYSIDIGHRPPGSMFVVNSGDISLTASDFGQFGFGQGSIYQAGGEGLRFRGSSNLLFEAGLIVGRNELMVSDAIRASSGNFKVSDFVPGSSQNTFAVGFDEDMSVTYVDNNAILPIPVEIEQDIYQSTQDFAIIQFRVVNPTPAWLDHLAIGLFCDFDIDRHEDRIGFDSLMDLLYQYDPIQGLYLGLVGVSANEFAYTAAQNGSGAKRGFSIAEKYELADKSGITIEGSDAGDWYCVVSRTAGQIDGFGNCKMAIVVAAGESLDELRAAAQAGMDEYNLYLDVDDDLAALPSTMELLQNSPNPFNPQTTIRFALGDAQYATLTVYNVAGQRVRTLFDGLARAGEHSVVWNGRDESGESVASGVYFYRLAAGVETQSRKMVFLK
jgi:subtilisin family serine protease